MIEMLDGTRETVLYREHFGIRLYINDVAVHYPLHWHTAVEIIMPLENRYTAVVDGTRYVLRPGDILLIPSGELHELYAPESGKRLILQFDYALFSNMNGFDSFFSMLRPCCLIANGQAGHYEELLPMLKRLLMDLAREYFGTTVFREAQAYALLIQFLVLLGRRLLTEGRQIPGSAHSSKRHRHIDTFMRICQYIQAHCTEDLRTEDLARLANLSKYHFARLFKQFTGMSCTRYIHQQRIMLAERMLIDPNASITEVALSSGFGSLATFNRVFKAHKKCTPSQYKRLHNPYSGVRP